MTFRGPPGECGHLELAAAGFFIAQGAGRGSSPGLSCCCYPVTDPGRTWPRIACCGPARRCRKGLPAGEGMPTPASKGDPGTGFPL